MLIAIIFVAAVIVTPAALYLRSVTRQKYVFFDRHGDKITDQSIIDQKIKELQSQPLTQEL